AVTTARRSGPRRSTSTVRRPSPTGLPRSSADCLSRAPAGAALVQRFFEAIHEAEGRRREAARRGALVGPENLRAGAAEAKAPRLMSAVIVQQHGVVQPGSSDWAGIDADLQIPAIRQRCDAVAETGVDRVLVGQADPLWVGTQPIDDPAGDVVAAPSLQIDQQHAGIEIDGGGGQPQPRLPALP